MIDVMLSTEQANALLSDVSRETQDTARENRLGVRELAVQLLQGVEMTPREITNRLKQLDSTSSELAADMATFPRRLAWVETITNGKKAESQLAELAQTRNALAEEELAWREDFGRRVAALNDLHSIANGKVASAAAAVEELVRTCRDPDALAARERILNRQQAVAREFRTLQDDITNKERAFGNMRDIDTQRWRSQGPLLQSKLDDLKAQRDKLVKEGENLKQELADVIAERFQDPACF